MILLGVTQLIIAVNKLDNTNWANERFEDIRAKLTIFLVRQAGFKETDLTFVPCSGLIGENLSKRSMEPLLKAWYQGPCLLEAIGRVSFFVLNLAVVALGIMVLVVDALRSPERPVGKPLRITVNDVFKGPGGLCVSGRVETGMVQAGDKIMIQPISEIVNVKSRSTRF